MADLGVLNKYGGPFTSEADVDDFVSRHDITEREKVQALYAQVRYARDTCLSLPKTSDFFRLKKNYRQLILNTYVTNLKVYLSKVGSCASVTWDDFDLALLGIQKQQN